MSDLQRQYLRMITDREANRERSDSSPDSYSFIVRVWKESSDEHSETSNWHGSVERVGQHQRVYVHQLDSIVRFIEEQTGIRVKHRNPLLAWWRGLRYWWDKRRNGIS